MTRTKTVLIALLAAVAAAPALAAQGVKVEESKPGLLKKAKITSEAAIATAQAKLPKAKLKAAEIEEENGKLIYSFDFETAGKTGIDEVNIDALTGKQVGKVEHESPASEKKEAAADSAKAAKARAKKP
ncbi:MAG TPA: PepSY domain-containing protein [Gemmatimonadaceae bacterium]